MSPVNDRRKRLQWTRKTDGVCAFGFVGDVAQPVIRFRAVRDAERNPSDLSTSKTQINLARNIAAFELWQANMFAVEPGPTTGESWEQFLDRLHESNTEAR